MSTSAQTSLNAALELSESERFMIVSGLLESLPPDIGLSEDDPGLIEELDRRCLDLEGAVSWSDLESEVD